MEIERDRGKRLEIIIIMEVGGGEKTQQTRR